MSSLPDGNVASFFSHNPQYQGSNAFHFFDCIFLKLCTSPLHRHHSHLLDPPHATLHKASRDFLVNTTMIPSCLRPSMAPIAKDNTHYRFGGLLSWPCSWLQSKPPRTTLRYQVPRAPSSSVPHSVPSSVTLVPKPTPLVLLPLPTLGLVALPADPICPGPHFPD